MTKKIVILACLFFSIVGFGQEGTASPYSYFGIGEVRFKGAAENRSMGGLSIVSDSIHINLQNPASYSDLKLSTFSIGGSSLNTNLKTDSQNGKAKRLALDYMAVGLPIGKLGVSFGLIPYSSVGYKIQTNNTGPLQNNKLLDGSGGLNKVFLGFGYKIARNFSVGADVQYNFGTIETSSFEYRSEIPIGTRQLNTAALSGLNFNIGAMYQAKLNKKLNLYTSVTFTPENILKSKSAIDIATASYDSFFNLNIIDKLDTFKDNVDFKYPTKFSLGAGIGENKKWLIGGEITMQNTVNLYNTYNNFTNVSFEKYSKYAIGGFFIPNYKSFTSYAKKIVYRGGFKYEQTGLVINSESINDIGLTLGLGLPLKGTFSNINVGFELGQKGTTKANLIQENYANISVGMSLNDKWFERRKFN